MAKKKSETSSETKETKPAAKKATTKPVAPKKNMPTQVGTPLVDTGLAAQNAAKLLAAGLKKTGQSGSTSVPQSKLFQQIKSGQSHASAIGGVLDKGGSQQNKPHLPTHGGNVKGHNQTFGSDASKAFVPRRTSNG
jgi:hypothetical protein